MAVAFKFDLDRTIAAMVYIASKKPRNLDLYKMCKLVFLSDKLHVVRFGRPITGDLMRAMEYGPVPSKAYDILKDFVAGNQDVPPALQEHLSIERQYSYPHFLCISALEFNEFLSRTDQEAIDEVLEAYGDKSFEELKILTHAMPSWKNAWSSEYRRTLNPEMAFEDFFLEDSNAISGAEDEMIEDYRLRQALDAGV